MFRILFPSFSLPFNDSVQQQKSVYPTLKGEGVVRAWIHVFWAGAKCPNLLFWDCRSCYCRWSSQMWSRSKIKTLDRRYLKTIIKLKINTIEPLGGMIAQFKRKAKENRIEYLHSLSRNAWWPKYMYHQMPTVFLTGNLAEISWFTGYFFY